VSEEARIIILLSMLALLAFYDIRQRTTNDSIFLIFGGMGVFLYLFDYQDVQFYDVLIIVSSTALGLVLWRFRVFGTGDLFAIVAMTVIYPVYLDLIPVPIVLLVGGYLLTSVTVPFLNLSQNIHDWANGKKPFEEITESKYRKFVAMFVVHRKRVKENLTFLAEKKSKGKRVLSLGTKDPNMEFAEKEHDGMYVEYTAPLLAFVFIAGILFFGSSLF
jgi:Flp pilus assembly protein protease CpaA